MIEVVKSSAVVDYPSKGHDRAFSDERTHTAAVFDGSDGPELSHAAYMNLLNQSKHGSIQVGAKWLLSTLTHLDNAHERKFRRSTGAIAQLEPKKKGYVEVHYANFGDSSIYLYDHHQKQIHALAHTPSKPNKVRRRDQINTKNFLGNGRTKEQLERFIGHMPMNKMCVWTLIGMSDGVTLADTPDLQAASLAEIIASTPADKMANTVLNSIPQLEDDASVFTISCRPSK